MWTLALQDGSTRETLLMYAHWSLTPLLAACMQTRDPSAVAGGMTSHGQSTGEAAPSLCGCRVRVAGPLRQPHRVVLVGKGGGSRQGRYLPTRALVLELDASDPAWAASELSLHPVLGGADFSRVCDLTAVSVGEILGPLFTHA